MSPNSVNKNASLLLVRLFLLVITLSSCVTISVSFSWRALLALACLAGTYLVTRLPAKPKDFEGYNPYRGKTGDGFLTQEAEAKLHKQIADLVVYDAGSAGCLKRFNLIKQLTECIFARKSRLWGSMDFDKDISLARNVERLVPTFYKFTLAFQDLGLNAFLIELPGDVYGTEIKTFSEAVRCVLLTLKDLDIQRQRRELRGQSLHLDPVDVENRMRYLGSEESTTWDRPSWVFEFNKVTFFITTFAPFYPDSNSRYGFGVDHCYLLFQPEISFAIHDLPPDTAQTNWDHPITVRDKIRVAFREAGREYEPPMATHLPMVYDIVKPLCPYDSPIEWWKGP